ncbi:Hypothetical protein PACV_104 [Pacmanvirus A23]|uniref:Hypothetical protein n=1 Tax=Pacmanvirus A23 TaxID=1932881 RepID=UPI000A095F10|nr:Hypothetical protein B9W72_gp103 [Pacmanvirus A23]SIP85820.1 Hypothetical protein PACV_104 [Pacmanvirus A23]
MAICRICKRKFPLENKPNLQIGWCCKHIIPNYYDMVSFKLKVGSQKEFITIHIFPYYVKWETAKSLIRDKHIYNSDIPSAAVKKDEKRKNNFYFNLIKSKFKLDLPNELIVMIAKLC